MRIQFISYSVLMTLFTFILSFAQQKIIFERLSVPDGLSSNNISGVCQDDYGYLWIATADGLNRYDGYNIEVFKYNPFDTLSLPASNISTVYKDSEGIIWAGSTDGLSERDPATGIFRNYHQDNSAPRERHIIKIVEDGRNRFWVGFRWAGL